MLQRLGLVIIQVSHRFNVAKLELLIDFSKMVSRRKNQTGNAVRNAEPFYRALGATFADTKPSASIPGRVLPVFHLEFDG